MKLTLESIRARCCEEGDCWIWQQGTTSSGSPSARDGDKSVLVRRKVLELDRGRPVRRGYFVVSDCDQLCCNPSHLRALNGSAYTAFLNAKGVLNDLSHKAATVAAVRRRSKVKTVETADAIRAAVEAGEDRGEIAKKHGIARGRVSAIARGDAWQAQPVANTSIFNLRA